MSTLIKSKIDKYREAFISAHFDRKERKLNVDKQFELFVNSLHCWNVSSQSFNSNTKIGKSISLGDAQGTDSFFVVINEKIYTLDDELNDVLKNLENTKNTCVKFHFIQSKNTENSNLKDFKIFVEIPLRVIKKQTLPENDFLKRIYEFVQNILSHPNLTNITHQYELFFYTTKNQNDIDKLIKDWDSEIKTLKNAYEEFTKVDVEIRGSQYLNNLYEIFNSNDFTLTATKSNFKQFGDCLIGYLTAKELLDCIAPSINDKRVLKSDVFKNNIRLYLGNTNVNRKIEDTLLKEPEKFYLYNNGITITTKDISDLHTYNYSISPVNIVNGCQTANSIFNVLSNKSELIEKVKIPTKIIKAIDDENNKITVRSNSQNGVDEKDLLAITAIQQSLENKFLNGKILDCTFQYKRQNSIEEGNIEYDFVVKIDDVLRAFFSTVLQRPHKVTAKFDETTEQFINSVFEDRLLDLYYLTTVLYRNIDDFISSNYPNNQRLKYHFAFLIYKIINKNNLKEVNELENYFKRKNKYYDTEEEMLEKKQMDYEQAKSNTDIIVSNLYNVFKIKETFMDLLKKSFESFKTGCPDFFDLSTKQKERILYKAVSNSIDSSKILDIKTDVTH